MDKPNSLPSHETKIVIWPQWQEVQYIWRRSTLRTLYQLSNMLVVASCSGLFNVGTLHKVNGIMIKEYYLQILPTSPRIYSSMVKTWTRPNVMHLWCNSVPSSGRPGANLTIILLIYILFKGGGETFYKTGILIIIIIIIITTITYDY